MPTVIAYRDHSLYHLFPPRVNDGQTNKTVRSNKVFLLPKRHADNEKIWLGRAIFCSAVCTVVLYCGAVLWCLSVVCCATPKVSTTRVTLTES